jgi:hypothetical protein
MLCRGGAHLVNMALPELHRFIARSTCTKSSCSMPPSSVTPHRNASHRLLALATRASPSSSNAVSSPRPPGARGPPSLAASPRGAGGSPGTPTGLPGEAAAAWDDELARRMACACG